MIFDTSFIIDLIRNRNNALAKIKELESVYEPCIVTAITIHELWRGLANANVDEERFRRIKDVLDGLVKLDFDVESAKISGKIEGILIADGKEIDPEDCMIAGIAMKNKEAVLSNDIHFSRINGLMVENY